MNNHEESEHEGASGYSAGPPALKRTAQQDKKKKWGSVRTISCYCKDFHFRNLILHVRVSVTHSECVAFIEAFILSTSGSGPLSVLYSNVFRQLACPVLFRQSTAQHLKKGPWLIPFFSFNTILCYPTKMLVKKKKKRKSGPNGTN